MAIFFVAVGSPAQEGGTGTATPAGRAGRAFGSGSGGARLARGPQAKLEVPRDTEMLPARFQATVYEVQASPEQAATLDAKALARQASTSETLLKTLGDVAKTRVLYRIDQPVNVFSDMITIGSQEPVITGTRMSDTGQAINSISYQNVGVIVRLSVPEPPKEADGKSPDVTLAVQLSTLVPGDTEIGPGQKGAGIRVATLEQSEPLAFDRPLVMFAVSSSPPQAKATPAVFVVRSQFGRLARSEGTAERATPAGKVADATVATEPLPAKPATETSAEIMPAQFQATFYEVRPAEGRAGALDASGLLAKAASADSLLKELADFGTSRILYRIDQPVNLLDDQMEISTNEPVLTAMRIGPAGQPMNTVMYRPSGVIVRLATQAPPNEAHNGGTNVAMMINFSTLTPSESPIGPGQAATVVRSMVFRHSEPLEFGHPRVILNVGPSSSGDRAIPLAYVVRYLFSPAAAK